MQVSFQPVPSQTDLQASTPAGRLAVAVKPFNVPQSAFGPGSVEYIRRQAEALELGEHQDGADTHSPSPRSEGDSPYAGAGSYF